MYVDSWCWGSIATCLRPGLEIPYNSDVLWLQLSRAVNHFQTLIIKIKYTLAGLFKSLQKLQQLTEPGLQLSVVIFPVVKPWVKRPSYFIRVRAAMMGIDTVCWDHGWAQPVVTSWVHWKPGPNLDGKSALGEGSFLASTCRNTSVWKRDTIVRGDVCLVPKFQIRHVPILPLTSFVTLDSLIAALNFFTCKIKLVSHNVPSCQEGVPSEHQWVKAQVFIWKSESHRMALSQRMIS